MSTKSLSTINLNTHLRTNKTTYDCWLGCSEHCCLFVEANEIRNALTAPNQLGKLVASCSTELHGRPAKRSGKKHRRQIPILRTHFPPETCNLEGSVGLQAIRSTNSRTNALDVTSSHSTTKAKRASTTRNENRGHEEQIRAERQT